MIFNNPIKTNIKTNYIVVVACLLCYFLFLFSTTSDSGDNFKYQTWVELHENQMRSKEKPFLINTTGCRIEGIDPFDPEVMKYFKKPEKIKCEGKILTYILKKGEDVYLVLNQTATQNGSLLCAYQGIERKLTAWAPDRKLIYTTELIYFSKKVLIKKQTVIGVMCENNYNNYHYIFNTEKQTNVYNDTKYNVLMIGLDAMSRSNILRTMNKTVGFIKKNGWVNLKGYNKILHNTCPNLMAATAGLGPGFNGCENKSGAWQDYNDFVWNHYKKQNYTTAYSEDLPKFSTYNYNKRGFFKAPTDYYLRPYYVAMRRLPIQEFCELEQCFGPENIGARSIEFVKEYVVTVKDRSNFFGFFWMNSFSHSSLSCPSNMDEDIADMFQHLKNEGILNNTIVIFFSDHGFRFGSIVETHTGWLENRLPFIFIHVPKSFRIHHREKYENLIKNSKKLTSPYDLFMTLHHILNLHNSSYVVRKPSSGCQNCHSLFEPISDERTCSNAGIPEYWCTCSKYIEAEKTDTMAKKSAEYAVNYVNHLIKDTNCSQYTQKEILEVKYYKTSGATVKNVMIRVQMEPPAKFELNIDVTISENTVKFKTSDIERLDRYADISWCCDYKSLKSYCYCVGSKVE